MATINVGINVKSNLEEQNNLATKLKNTLQATGNTRITAPVAAARQGVAATRQGVAASSSQGNTRESGLSRSLGVGTGAEGRDFAKQAQGLGGLVHVYATFAANIFAVSAAFTALSKAADTTNLIKGLDQLGSFSGRALGSVAKQLSTVTDGAISLRDAMTATAQASAGGMTNSTILRMGMVAKQASQALGVAMPDALSRLSRGITKIEPELLDEIGIMVRVDTASQNYARTLGKTASSLTDFEKRQGFANAVLEQGEKKFGALKLDANPYAKISASMANIAQTGLELINLVLKPIVSLLSSSPVALAGAMGLIAAALLKQALPALGMFKENMQVAADQARNLALTRAVEAQKGYKAEFVASKTAAVAKAKSDYNIAVANAEAIAIAKGDILDDAEAKIKSLREKSKKGSVAQELLSKDLHEISAKDIARLDANAAQLESKALKQALAGNAEKAESLVKSAEAQRGYAEAIRHSQKTEADYFAKERQAILERDEALKKVNITEEAAAKAKLANRSLFDTDRQTQIIADRALLKSASQNIVSQAAQTAAVKGYSEAVKEAKEAVAKARSGPSTKLMDLGNTELDAAGKTIAKLEEVTTPAMGRMQGQWTLMKTRISAATSAIGTFMNAFGVWSFVIGAVVAGLGLLDSWLSKTQKEMVAANNALAVLEDSLTNIDRVISNIDGYGSIEIISSATLQASANAVNDLSDNLDRGLKAALAYKAKVGFFDSILEGWKMMFGISIPDKVAKNITESINKILQLAQPGPEVDKFKEKLSQILKIDPNDTEALNKALTLGNIEDKGPLVVKAIQEISAEMVKLGSKSKAVDDAFVVSSKAYDTVTASLSPSDNLAKLGFSMIDLGNKMSEAFSSPVAALSQLAAISDDVSKLRFFDEKTASQFIKESSNIKETSNALVVYSKILSDLRTEEAQIDASLNKKSEKDPREIQNRALLTEKKATVVSQKESLTEVINSLQAKIRPLMDLLAKGVDASFVRGATLVANSIGIEFAKSGIIISKALSEGLGNTLGAIDQKARLDTESIDLQIRQINTTIDLIKSNEKLIALQEEDSLRKQRDALVKDGAISGKENSDKYDELGKRIAAKIYQREVGFSNMKEVTSGLKGEGRALQETPRERLARLSDGNLANPEVIKLAAQGSLAGAQQTEASKASIAALNAQKEAIAIDKKFKTMTELNNIDKDNLVTKQYSLNVTKAELDAISSNALYLSQETAMRKNAVTEQQALNAVELANKDILLEKKKALEVLSKYAEGSKGYAEAQLSLDQIGTKLANKNARDKEDSLIRQIGYQQALLAAKQAEIAFEIGMLKQREDSANLERNTQISIAEETQARFTAVGAYTDEEIAKLNTKLALEKEIQRSKEVQTTLSINIASEQTSLGFKLATIPTGDNPERKAIEEKMAANASAYNQAIDGEAKLTAAKQATLQVQGAMSALQAKQSEDMAKMASITDSLSTLFGTLGESIGKAGESMLKLADENARYAATEKERKELSDKINDPATDVKSKLDATNKLTKLEKDHTKAELSGITSVAGATKKFFNEKSAGYKLLNNIEKASSAMSMALQLKDLATSLGILTTKVTAEGVAETSILGIKVASAPAKVAADAPGILSSFSQMGPIGYAIGAALVASLLSMVGGGGGSVSPGPSQEEMRAVQGTGQAYNSAGTLVDTGKGVFGDPTAVNKGIKESLDLLAATAKPELAYTSKMVMLLANIDNSLSGAANSLTASGFKIDPASYASLGRTKEGGGLGNLSIPLVGNLLGKVLGGFGGSASSYFEVTGGGFEVPLQSLTEAVNNFISKGYVVANKIASDGGIQAIRNPDEYGGRGTEVNAEFNASIGRALKEASTTAKEVAIAFGASSQEVDATLSNFVVNMGDIDLFGAKTLEEKSEIINAKIGGVIDDILEQTLPTALREFRKGGETLLTTASRVSSGIEEANFYLNQLGVTSVKYTEVLRTLGDVSSEIVRQSILLKEGTNGVAELINAFSGTAEEISSFYTELSSLRTIFEDTGVSTNILTSKFLNLGGGLSKISGEVSDYYKNFYSEAERNLDRAKAVSAKLGKVGLTYSPEEIVSMTKAQFRGIVEGLGTVTPESEAAYIALMGVSGAINEIASSAKNSNADQIQLLKLQGKEVEALRLTRLNELDGLVGTARLIRTQIHDQEDLNKTKSLELGLATALGMTTEVLNYTRQKELDTLSLMDRAIKQATYAIEDFNKTRDLEVALLTAQGDILAAVTHAREKELKGLSESNKLIQQRIYLLQDEATTIAAAKAVESARVTVANAYAGFVNAAKTSGETLVSAEENITRGYLAAKDKADKALIASNDVVLGEADRVSKAGIETGKKLKDFAKNIRKFIDEITYGSIDTNHQLVYLQRVFDDTLAKARTGNEDALNTLTDSASKLLEKGKDTSVTFLDFARLTGRTAADLTSVADALDAKADPLLVSILGLTDEQIAANDAAKDYAKRSLEAQTALNDANKELADWTKAVKESTASTEEILIDYAKDWRKANTEDIKARSELLEATKIIGATNSKVPTALDGLRDAMTAMGTAIQSLATNLGAFTGAVLSAVQSQQLSAADAVTKLAAVGTNLAKDSISTVATATDNTTVYASSTGKALAIDNKDGKDYTVYGTTIKATGQEIRDWIAKQTNPIDIYNGAVSQGISSQMLADIASFPVSEIRDWVSANNLPAFAFGGDHSGGIRLVGENGPEIESTGPSRIFNASQTRGMLQQDNSELIAEIRLLRSEVKELKEINKASSDSEKTTAKQLTRWDTDGMPPIRT